MHLDEARVLTEPVAAPAPRWKSRAKDRWPMKSSEPTYADFRRHTSRGAPSVERSCNPVRSTSRFPPSLVANDRRNVPRPSRYDSLGTAVISFKPFGLVWCRVAPDVCDHGRPAGIDEARAALSLDKTKGENESFLACRFPVRGRRSSWLCAHREETIWTRVWRDRFAI
jgi:hypothetical protein